MTRAKVHGITLPVGHNTLSKKNKIVLQSGSAKKESGNVDPQPSQIGGYKTLSEFLEANYDPDKEFIESNTPTNSKLSEFIEALRKAPAEKQPKVQAKIIEVNGYGCYRVTDINDVGDLRKAVVKSDAGWDQFKRLMENGVRLREAKKLSADDVKKLRESFDFDTGDTGATPVTGPFGNNGDFNEYLPMLGGPFSKQLYLFDYLDMHRKCFEAWNHNPLARQIVKITTHFVLGRGITWKACHPQCQDNFNKWADAVDLNGRLEYWCDMLTRDGELMIRKFYNPLSKQMFLRWVDPSTIWEIITDLEDIELVFYYHQQYPTQYQVLYGTGGENAKFKPQDFKAEEYIINQIPADDIWHYKINCSPNEKRGRSDLFPILGWLKRHKDLWTAQVLRAIMQGTYVWKNVLKGSDADVQDYINRFGTQQPKFGSVYVENESSTLTPMPVNTSGTSGTVDDSGLVNMIAVGAGIAKEYIGFSEHSSRSTAVVGTEPSAKKFQARQQLLGRVLRDISQKWGELEIKTGRLPEEMPKEDKLTDKVKKAAEGKPGVIQRLKAALAQAMGNVQEMEPHKIKIAFQFPEIAIEDRSAKIKDVDFAYTGGYISKSRAGTIVAKELGAEDYDFEEEMAERDQEAQDDADRAYSLPGEDPAAGGLKPGAPPAGHGAPRGGGATPEPGAPPKANTQGLGSSEKKDIKSNDARPG